MKTIYKSELEKSGYYPDVIDALVELATLNNKAEYSIEAFFYKGEWHSYVAAECLKKVAYSLIGIIEGLSPVDSFPCEMCIYFDQYVESEFNKESRNHIINVLNDCNEDEDIKRIAIWYVIMLLEINISWNATYPDDTIDFSIDIVG